MAHQTRVAFMHACACVCALLRTAIVRMSVTQKQTRTYYWSHIVNHFTVKIVIYLVLIFFFFSSRARTYTAHFSPLIRCHGAHFASTSAFARLITPTLMGMTLDVPDYNWCFLFYCLFLFVCFVCFVLFCFFAMFCFVFLLCFFAIN